MAIDVGRNWRAPAPTNVEDAATEADFLCALRKCVLLLASITATGVFLGGPVEPDKQGLLKSISTVHGMVFECCSATALGASIDILVRLQSKVLGTKGIKYFQLQIIITLDLLCLIGAYSAASVKTSISVVTLVAAVLLYVAIQVLLFLSKPVGRLFSHVQETPPHKCVKSQKRIRRQQTIVSRQSKDDVYVVATMLCKYMFLIMALVSSAVYEVRVGPMSSGSGNPDTHTTYPQMKELVHFRWNDTGSVAALVFILMHVLSTVFSKQRVMYCALQVAMPLDLFILVVAYISRSGLQLPTFVYTFVLAPVFVYAGIMAMVSTSEMPTCTESPRVLTEKMEQYCVPNWLNRSFELPTNEHTEEVAAFSLEEMRQIILILSIMMANLIRNLARTSLSPGLQLDSCPGHVVGNSELHSNGFYVGGNLTEQAGISSLSSLFQENISGNLNLAFYCYSTAFIGSLAIMVLLANRKVSSRRIHCCVMRLLVIVVLITYVGGLAAGNIHIVELLKVAVISIIVLIVFHVTLSRGPKKRVQSIFGWLQHALREDPSEEEGSEDELEFGLAGGSTSGEPVAVEISSPILGGALTLVLGIPVMRMAASPVKTLVVFVITSVVVDVWRRLFARLLQALARALHRRCILQDQCSAPPSFGTTSLARRGWRILSATCHGLCKIIQALFSGAWVWILVLVIWMPWLKPNLKLKFKISNISALLGVLIAIATKTTTATGTRNTSTTATATTSGTTTRRTKHQPRIEPRPKRNCRPNTRLISEEWVK